MAAQPSAIRFTLGSRQLLSVPRRLVPLTFSLDDVLASRIPSAGTIDVGDGVHVVSAPTTMVAAVAAQFPRHVIGGRQDYRRHYIDMSGSFDGYLGHFSSKTRSTLRRKRRKLADAVGGALELREYRAPGAVEVFLREALPLSAMTYQARLLGAGLPQDAGGQAAMLRLAEAGCLRCFLLLAGERPVAYLSLPVEGATLVYAHLGYHPDWARLSPGTVLHMLALERLFAERRFRWFDFTAGDGPHKAMFATGSAECASFVLLKDDLPNRLLLGSLAVFDGSVAAARALAQKSGALAQARKLLRG